MEINSATSSEVSVSFNIANDHFKFAKVVGLYDFKDGSLSYDVYPILGLTAPRIILTQPIVRDNTRMPFSRAILTMYELEKSSKFGFDSELGYHIQFNEYTYIWTIDDDGMFTFIKTKDDSEEAEILFKIDMNSSVNNEIQSIFFNEKGKPALTKSIKYKLIS